MFILHILPNNIFMGNIKSSSHTVFY